MEKTKALDNVSFEVYRGEVFAYLEPKGAGKTTTVEILEGIRKPTSGRIEISDFIIVFALALIFVLLGSFMTRWENKAKNNVKLKINWVLQTRHPTYCDQGYF